jgi:integrase/recombinase XerD
MSSQLAKNPRYSNIIKEKNHHQFSVINDQDEDSNVSKDELMLNRKIDNAVAGLGNYLHRLLAQQVSNRDNAASIADYIATMRTETNLSDNYRASIINTLSALSKKYHNHKKSFRQMTREDIITYLDSLRRPEASDPLHKWIGTYNLCRIHFIRFFKWLYYPDIEHTKRPKPSVIENITQLKRKEKSIYKPTDLWTAYYDSLFLKYCPDKRIRCYHTIARDSSCRPSELLVLRVKDIVFKTANGRQYAEVLVNGKTGSRHIPLFNSIPYLKDWINDHPQQGNPNSFLIPSKDRKNFGKKMREAALRNIYKEQYQKQFFPKLLEDPSVPPEDKQKIKELLKKPWTPYIRRHSALTEKSMMLKEHILRQHAGWSGNSQMHLKYLHYFGNESSESLLEAYGIVTKDQQLIKDTLKPKQCPNCNEPNKPDSRFCAKCRMVLTYDAYSETIEQQRQKEDDLQILKNQMQALITAIGNMGKEGDQEKVNEFSKTLFDSGILKTTTTNHQG